MKDAFLKLALNRLTARYPDAVFPKNVGEMAEVLDRLKPEGVEFRVWPGVRGDVADHLGVERNDADFHIWFNAVVVTR